MHGAFSMPKIKQIINQDSHDGCLFSCLEGGDALTITKSRKKNHNKVSFDKKLLITDYVILLLLIAVFVAFIVLDKDTTNIVIIIGAWITQLAVSSGCYYWKAKSENLVKLPIWLLNDLPEDMREKADPNSIIASVVGIGTHNNNS